MKKKIAVGSILLLAAATGCFNNKNNLKTKSEILEYAEKKYGKASYESDTPKSSSITYTLKDDKNKFKYTCTSSSVKGNDNKDIENTECDFDQKYSEYIINELDLDNTYERIPSTNNSGDNTIFGLKFEDEETMAEKMPEISKKIKEIDSRKYFKDYYVKVFDNSGTYLGSYSIEKDIYENKYEERVEQITNDFTKEIKENNENPTDVYYLYYKRLQYKDVDKLKLEWLEDNDVKDTDWTTAYYFNYNDETYFMLDDRVTIENEDGIKGNHSSKNYTSYWFE